MAVVGQTVGAPSQNPLRVVLLGLAAIVVIWVGLAWMFPRFDHFGWFHTQWEYPEDPRGTMPRPALPKYVPPEPPAPQAREVFDGPATPPAASATGASPADAAAASAPTTPTSLQTAPAAVVAKEAVVTVPAPTQVASPAVATVPRPAVVSAKSGTASAYLPMAIRGRVSSPSDLADRIRESLARDPSGDGRVRDANATPNHFLSAIQKAGGTVVGVAALPAYLESLVQGEMPEGLITMSRTLFKRDASGHEIRSVDLTKGYARHARVHEVGWYDANTNFFIIASDCFNSPLTPMEGKRVVHVYQPPSTPPPVHKLAPQPTTPAPVVKTPPKETVIQVTRGRMPRGTMPRASCPTSEGDAPCVH